jgi:hypothetical protein
MSVTPPKAETTTITLSSREETICLTSEMDWGDPTEVPPNLRTFITLLTNGCSRYEILLISPNFGGIEPEMSYICTAKNKI